MNLKNKKRLKKVWEWSIYISVPTFIIGVGGYTQYTDVNANSGTFGLFFIMTVLWLVWGGVILNFKLCDINKEFKNGIKEN